MNANVGDFVEQVDGCCERTRATIGWRGKVEMLAVVLESECKFCGAPMFGLNYGVTIEVPGCAPAKWFRPVAPAVEPAHQPEAVTA